MGVAARRLSAGEAGLGTNSAFVPNPTTQLQKNSAAPYEERAAELFVAGRGGEIRTPDPHNPIVVRYQAALRPDRCESVERPRIGRFYRSSAGARSHSDPPTGRPS